MTIWKYTIEIADVQVLMLPAGARILTVQIQHGTVCAWAVVDPEALLVARKLFIVGTGHPTDLNESDIYLGTVQQGGFVWHVFEGKP